MENCLFCKKEIFEIIIENDEAFAIFDKFPTSPGHMLIIPKKHYNNWFETPQSIQIAMMELLDIAKKELDVKFNPDGYNIGLNCGKAAGQTIFHTHMHLIPRYENDVKEPEGGVRGVIPERQKY